MTTGGASRCQALNRNLFELSAAPSRSEQNVLDNFPNRFINAERQNRKMKVSRVGLLLLLIMAPLCKGQTPPDMATGLSPYATYVPDEIDNVNPANGNI